MCLRWSQLEEEEEENPLVDRKTISIDNCKCCLLLLLVFSDHYQPLLGLSKHPTFGSHLLYVRPILAPIVQVKPSYVIFVH